jgi:ferric-dicitrate binding protein FerR (iron transport regulator)
LSAVFPLQGEDATDRILATLPQVLPVQVQTVTPWWVTVGPRGAA